MKLWNEHEDISYVAYKRAQYDLDFQACDMVLTSNTSSCHDDHLCQIVLKSNHAGPRYGSDTSVCHLSLVMRLT